MSAQPVQPYEVLQSRITAMESRVCTLARLVEALTMSSAGWVTDAEQKRRLDAYETVSRDARRQHLEAELRELEL